MLGNISLLNRYISCAQVTKRPIFEFISSKINPNAALMVFSFEDDYSFGIIASQLHWLWFVEKCSTLGEQFRYTTDSIWDTFPWPQNPDNQQVEQVADAALQLRLARRKIMQQNRLTLRDLYRTLDKPGKNPIKDLQEELNQAVMVAYGFDPLKDLLLQLLDLNQQVHQKELMGNKVTGPGIPYYYPEPERLISEDCVILI